MFTNLQNKIDLKKLQEEKINIDKDFAFKEDFDVVSQTLQYFEQKKNEIDKIIIKEEIEELEDQDKIEDLEELVKDQQEFIYNDDDLSDMAAEVLDDEVLQENFNKYLSVKGVLPTLLEEANNDMTMELDKYRMVDLDFVEGEFDVEALFDKETIDKARHEQLDDIQTVNWLEKRLIDYRKNHGNDMPKEVTVVNGLRKLDVNDPEEIKNKIKHIQESVQFLKIKKVIGE